MENILIIACLSILIADYFPDMVERGKILPKWFKRSVRYLFRNKPLSCSSCLSIWIAALCTLIDFNYIYIPIVPILVEGINRHLRILI